MKETAGKASSNARLSFAWAYSLIPWLVSKQAGISWPPSADVHTIQQ